jgi:putative peptidoglycan lipid II flippase
MGAAMWFISLLLTGLLETPYLRYVALIILLTVGFLSYFGMAQITGALRIKDLRQATKR